MKSLLLLRLAVAACWLYQGLYLKLIARDALTLHTMASWRGALSPTALTLVGVAETLLGLAVLIGLWMRPLALVQLVLLLGLDAMAIAAGAGQPVALLVGHLPFLACLGMLALHGPGRWHV